MKSKFCLVRCLRACLLFGLAAAAVASDEARLPRDGAELRRWLEEMVWHHGYTTGEIRQALGLPMAEIESALVRFDIRPATRPARPAGAPLLVCPYPGGRHPRIGFLEGAVNPQRETKLSVITPWDESSYVVLDVPEAVWSNLGLTYLAHTHVPTIWSQRKINLPRLEWNRRADGCFDIERTLPNGIAFGVEAKPARNRLGLRMWLKNGTSETLSDLRVQMCAMLKGAHGFEAQTNDNKIFEPPFAACRDTTGKRWIIQSWQPHHRVWGNEKCPCLHADPKLPDTPAGDTSEARGWLSFYEGDDVRSEFRRLAVAPNFESERK